MDEQRDPLQLTRDHWAALCAIPVVYQLYVWVRSLGQVGRARRMFAALLGSVDKLPGVTKLVLATHTLWVAVPILTAVAVWQFRNRKSPTATHAIALMVIGATIALVMSTLVEVGIFAPIMELQSSLSSQ